MASLVSVGADAVSALAAAEAGVPHRVHPTGWGARRVQDALLIVHRAGIDGPIESWLPCPKVVLAAPMGAFGVPHRSLERLGVRGPYRTIPERAAALVQALTSFELPLTRAVAEARGPAALRARLGEGAGLRLRTAAFDLAVELEGPDRLEELAAAWVAEAKGPTGDFESAWAVLRRPGGVEALAHLAATGPHPEVHLRAARALFETLPRPAALAYVEPLLGLPVDPLVEAGLRRLVERLEETPSPAPADDDLSRLLRGLPATRTRLLSFLDDEESTMEDKAQSLRALALGPRRGELLSWVRRALLRPDGLGWTAIEIAEMWRDPDLLEAALAHPEAKHAGRALAGLGRVASWPRLAASLPRLLPGPLDQAAMTWAVRRAPDAQIPLRWARTEGLRLRVVEAARGLGVAGVEVLAGLVGAPEPGVQQAAVEALREMAHLAPEDLADILDAQPKAPSSPIQVQPSSSPERFQRALRAAVEAGARGLPILRRLARSKRVPTTLRLRALRHLARDVHPETRSLFETLLLQASGPLAEAALGGVMQREDVALSTVRSFIETSKDPPVRARAARFLSSRWPKAETRPLLGTWLRDRSAEVQRAALDGLFPSLRFVSLESVGSRLVNLMEVHADLETRRAAAVALGSFGGPRAMGALRRASGSDVGPEAAEALRRLQAVEGPSGL